MPIFVPSTATTIVTTDQAKTFLNISSTTYDDELTRFIAAASQAICNRIGQVVGPVTMDEWHDGGDTRIVLRNPGPVTAITSLTESWGVIDYTLTQIALDDDSPATAFGYTVDLDAGVIVRRSSGIAVCFAPGIRNVHVAFTAGYTAVPADLTQACLLLLSHMWETQRGGAISRRPGSGPPDDIPLSFTTWPRRVEELLAPYMMPGIA